MPYFGKTERTGSNLPPDIQRRMHEGRTKPAQRRSRRMALLWSYLPDWILCIGLAACFFLLDFIDGFWREFDLTDTSIQHTFTKNERVPNLMLLLLVFVAPLVILPIINFCTIRSYWDLHNSWLGLVLALSTTGVVSQVVKVCVGRPRPDLIARCMPAPGSVNAAVSGLANATICTQTDVHIMRDGFRSFPSAHSSLSFAGLGFLSFYLAGKLHLFDERGYTGKAWVALTPLTGAALIAISRTMDYRHHWQDVLTGSTLGLILGFFAYRQYYPSLVHPLSHRPYSPRIPNEVPRVANDEEMAMGHSHSDTDSHDESGAHRRSESAGTRPLFLAKPALASDTTLLAPPARASSKRPQKNAYSDEEIEMESQDIGTEDTVPRPHQDLEEVWAKDASSIGQQPQDAGPSGSGRAKLSPGT